VKKVNYHGCGGAGLGASYVPLEITAAPTASRLRGFAVRHTTLGVRFHSFTGPRVAVRLRWDTEDGTPVPKHVGFDTYRELYFIAVYGLHLLVNP
jgi:hypothetical protein